MWPLMDVSDLIGASWLPTDGQANPSDITLSLAKGARMAGVKIFEDTPVTRVIVEDGRVRGVETPFGTIECEKVIVCAGQWTRALAASVGVNVPLVSVEHQYMITEKIEGVTPNLPTLRDPDRRTYFKEEVGGLVMGGYEPNPQPWLTGDLPDDWAFRLFDDDFDHFEQHMIQAIERVPALEQVGWAAAAALLLPLGLIPFGFDPAWIPGMGDGWQAAHLSSTDVVVGQSLAAYALIAGAATLVSG